MLIFSGKFHCYNSTFIDVYFASLFSKEHLTTRQLILDAWNQHSVSYTV